MTGTLYTRPPTRMLSIALLHLFTVLFVECSDSSGSDCVGCSEDTFSPSQGVTGLLSSTKGMRVGKGMLAVGAMLVGLIVCLAGYRLFRPTVFCSAFVVGGLFLAGIIETAFASLDWMPTASWIGFAVGGLIAGIAVLFLYSASIFLGGAAGGVMLAFTINTSVGTKIIPSNPDILLVILALLLGILGGSLALKLEKPVLITATAIVGATICVWGVGYFAGDYPNGADLKAFGKKNDDGDWVYHIPDAWWGYLGAMAVLFMLGMSAQIGKTARGYDHGGQRESHGIKKNPDHAAV